jgi:hypothetical protein
MIDFEQQGSCILTLLLPHISNSQFETILFHFFFGKLLEPYHSSIFYPKFLIAAILSFDLSLQPSNHAMVPHCDLYCSLSQPYADYSSG